MTSMPKKIIIVEDQPAVADLFEEMLGMDGYQVIKIHTQNAQLPQRLGGGRTRQMVCPAI